MPAWRQRRPNARLVYWLPWMLSCLSIPDRTTRRRELGTQARVDLPSHVALEAADDLELGEAIGGAAGHVAASALVGAETADDDHVQGAVGAAVAAAVESMALGLPGGGGQRRGPAEHGEARLAAKALGVVAGGHEELARVLDADAYELKQPRRQLLHQGGDEVVQLGDLVVQLEDAACQRAQADAGGHHGVAEAGRVRPPRPRRCG
jgi:hypothetical protein